MLLIELISALNAQLEEMKCPASGLTVAEMRLLHNYAASPEYRQHVENWADVRNRIDSYRAELDLITSYLARNAVAQTQSLAEGLMKNELVDQVVVEHHQNLTEIGGAETVEVKDETKSIKYISMDTDLNDFFLRPIQIGQFPLVVGTPVTATYDIASRYLADPSVRAKLRNYAFMRGTFVVRVAVSGTPFDYGRLIVASYPWTATNTVYNRLFGIGSTLNTLQNQYLSQARNSTIIDLKENRPVDIELPYISPIPVGRLFNDTPDVIASGVGFDDFDKMWTTVIKTLNVRGCISTSPSDLTVYIYAYMRDVQIGIPTGTNLAITTQSGTDERKTGPVQRVASNLLSISTRLHDVPYIGMYARASSFVLGGIKGVASLFGWSAPVINVLPHRVKNEPYQNGAQLIQNDTSQKITLDPKQELAISTEYTNTTEDELVISSLCGKQSYLTSINWQSTSAPLAPISFIPIHPRLNVPQVTTPSNTRNVLPSPMNHVSQLFGKWHGKIVITLEVVCSAFHRGKLLVLFEPNVMHANLVAANMNLNKQYAHVWDIQETQRYSICVEWNSPRPWMNNVNNTNSNILTVSPSFSPATWMVNAVNGILIVSPLTRITSPDNSTVSINVYVHGEDMQFNRLTTKFMPANRNVVYNSGISTQSGVVESDSQAVVSQVDSSCIPINPSSVAEKGIQDHFYGEAPVSLRSIFKRFVTTSSQFTQNGITTVPHRLYAVFKILPDITPSIAGVSNPLGSGWAVNHMRYCFHSIRGSMRKRINVYANGVVAATPTSVTLSVDSSNAPVAIGVQSLNASGVLMETDGTAKFVAFTNGGIEVEIPYYNSNYYSVASQDDAYDPSTIKPMDGSEILRVYNLYTMVPASADYTIRVTEDTATGEDFQMSYFLGTAPYVSA